MLCQNLRKMAAALSISLFLRFCVVGCSNVLVTLVAFYVLYNFLAMNYLIASVVAYSLGIVNSFTWNRLWTFRIRGSNAKIEFVKFLVVNLTGLGINSCIMLFLVGVIGVKAVISQIIAIGLIFILNFSLVKLWVFPCGSHTICEK